VGAMSTLLLIVGAYAGVGLIVAIAFALAGAATIDHAVRDSPKSFRILLMPGALALWPVVVTKWIRAIRAARATEGAS